MTYENRKTHKLLEVSTRRNGFVYFKGGTRVKQSNLTKSYKKVEQKKADRPHVDMERVQELARKSVERGQEVGKDWNEKPVERPEPRPLSTVEPFVRTSVNPDVGVHYNPQYRAPEPMGPLHEPAKRDHFTRYVGTAGAFTIALIILIWALT